MICKGGCDIKRLKRRIWAVLLALSLLPVCIVQASSEVPEYLTQEGSRTCTLCAATMMLRSCIYISGSDLWQQVSEASVSTTAWTSDGLYWNWNYCVDGNNMSVAQQGLSGITVDGLKAVLDTHPEGVVLYCGGAAPHAVFLTDYEDGTFYCADPAYGYSGSRIPLEQSLLGARHGDQGSILAAVCAYWYVDSHTFEDRSYIRRCQEYPSETQIRVRWDGYAMSLPAAENRCAESKKMIPIRCGDFYTAQTLVVNDAGEYWYEVGENIYISAADAPCVSDDDLECDLPVQLPQPPEQEVIPLMLFSAIKIPQNY